MARILLPCPPLLGHLQPVLVVARALRRRGHQVDVLTGPGYADLVRAYGVTMRALPPAAMSRPLPASSPTVLAPRWVQARRDVLARFIVPLAAQSTALGMALESADYDVVVADTAYLGALPLLLGSGPPDRPPVVGISATPISAVSVDAAPFGSGLRNADTRFAHSRNRQVNWLLRHGPMRPVHEALDRALAAYGVAPGTASYFDLLGHFDVTYQLSLPELEYPRRELPSTVRCVGPLPIEAADWTPPEWWGELDRTRPLVHVTQGTLDNTDLDRLVVPAVRALRDRDVTVVVTTGRALHPEDRAALTAAAPGRVQVADFIPYDVLLPRTDLIITNGGWGGVQQAARHGVPVIVAGATEEKPEVAARVAWSGLGINLRTGRPRPARIRSAVDTVLGAHRYRDRARQIADAAAARPDPLRLIVTEVEALTARSTGRQNAGRADPDRHPHRR